MSNDQDKLKFFHDQVTKVSYSLKFKLRKFYSENLDTRLHLLQQPNLINNNLINSTILNNQDQIGKIFLDLNRKILELRLKQKFFDEFGKYDINQTLFSEIDQQLYKLDQLFKPAFAQLGNFTFQLQIPNDQLNYIDQSIAKFKQNESNYFDPTVSQQLTFEIPYIFWGENFDVYTTDENVDSILDKFFQWCSAHFPQMNISQNLRQQFSQELSRQSQRISPEIFNEQVLVYWGQLYYNQFSPLGLINYQSSQIQQQNYNQQYQQQQKSPKSKLLLEIIKIPVLDNGKTLSNFQVGQQFIITTQGLENSKSNQRIGSQVQIGRRCLPNMDSNDIMFNFVETNVSRQHCIIEWNQHTKQFQIICTTHSANTHLKITKDFPISLQEQFFFQLALDYVFVVVNIAQINIYENSEQQVLENPITQGSQQVVDTQKHSLMINKDVREQFQTYKNPLYNNSDEGTLPSDQQLRSEQQDPHASLIVNKKPRDNQALLKQSQEESKDTIVLNKNLRTNYDKFYNSKQEQAPFEQKGQYDTIKVGKQQRKNFGKYYNIEQNNSVPIIIEEHIEQNIQQQNSYGQPLFYGQNPQQQTQQKIIGSESQITLICTYAPEENKQYIGKKICFNTKEQNKRIFSIGKSPHNDEQIMDGSISGAHCQLQWSFESGWQIGEQLMPGQSRPSTNGTFLALKNRKQYEESTISNPWTIQKNMVFSIEGTEFLAKELI